MNRTRRQFVGDVGKTMVAASVGFDLAHYLLPGTALAADEPERLTFGTLEPLVSLMQETPAERLLPIVVERLRQGTELRQIVAAAALANARSFGGEDYVGFHTMMAIPPAYHMAQELPADVERAARAVPGVTDVKVEIVFDPPWDSCKMSEAARLKLGLL